MHLSKEIDNGVSDNNFASSDLEQLRNLKHQVLNYGQSKPKMEDRRYYENFYLEFTQTDIMYNYKVFCLP